MQKIPRVLGVWELGAGLGHVARLHAIGQALREEGIEFAIAARDLAAVSRLAGDLQYPVFQAPYAHPRGQLQRMLASLADVLLLQGFTDPVVVKGLMAGWKSLLELYQPDLIIFDHAPAALLASYKSGIAGIVVGNAFTMPAPGRPLSDWRPLAHDDHLVEESQKLVLAGINPVLEDSGHAPWGSLVELYQDYPQIISHYPLLDRLHKQRRNAIYQPFTHGKQGTVMPVLAPRHDLQLLCYLHPAYKSLPALLTALKRLQAEKMDVVVVAPGLDTTQVHELQSAGISASNLTVDMQALMSRTDCFLGHGSVGTITQALSSGVPCLLLPLHLEQLNNSMQIQQAGLGQIIPEHKHANDFFRHLITVTDDKTSGELARQFAAKHPLDAGESFERAVVRQIKRQLVDAYS